MGSTLFSIIYIIIKKILIISPLKTLKQVETKNIISGSFIWAGSYSYIFKGNSKNPSNY